MTTVRGIDLSNNNGRQNWPQLYRDGVRFAFLKASEGNHTADESFSAHVRDAKAANIPILGSYHFAWPNESATTNARNYVGRVGPHAGPGWVHWLDLEPYEDGRNYSGTTFAERAVWVRAWISAVQHAFPRHRVGVYAGGGSDAAVPATAPRWYPAYPWQGAPAWTHAEQAARPRRAGRPVEFWQFADKPTDRSLWFGSLAQLEAWAHGGTASSPAKPKPAPKPKPPAKKPRSVTVRSGMTLSGIALILGCSVTALAHYNHIHNPNLIYPGQVISAPPVAPKPKPKPPAKKPRPAACTSKGR